MRLHFHLYFIFLFIFFILLPIVTVVGFTNSKNELYVCVRVSVWLIVMVIIFPSADCAKLETWVIMKYWTQGAFCLGFASAKHNSSQIAAPSKSNGAKIIYWISEKKLHISILLSYKQTKYPENKHLSPNIESKNGSPNGTSTYNMKWYVESFSIVERQFESFYFAIIRTFRCVFHSHREQGRNDEYSQKSVSTVFFCSNKRKTHPKRIKWAKMWFQHGKIFEKFGNRKLCGVQRIVSEVLPLFRQNLILSLQEIYVIQHRHTANVPQKYASEQLKGNSS